MDTLILAIIEDWLKELIKLSEYIKDARKDNKLLLKGTHISILSKSVYIKENQSRDKLMYDYCYKEPLNDNTIKIMCEYLNLLDKPNYVFDKVWKECIKNDVMWEYYFYSQYQLIKELLHDDIIGETYGQNSFIRFI